ncbi:MAG: amidohydrolase [Balneolales bacterium]
MNFSEIRKRLHTMAEIAHQENKTAAFVAQVLHEAGMDEVQVGIGGNGILATVKGKEAGPVVLFRAELDALPIAEAIDIPHASNKKSISHKCGHDGHMAILLGLAHELNRHPVKRGMVHLLFQPAEETGEGAHRMFEDQRMSEISPDYVFALHNLPGYPVNTVLLRDDIFAAGSMGLIVRLTGNTAHAAHPENAISPSSAVAALIHDWQALPQTIIPFDRAGLVTIIHAHIGERAFGTTPGYAELMATIRAHEPDDLKKLGKRAMKLAESTASLWKLKIEQEWTEVFQPTRNDPEAVAMVEKVAHNIIKNNSRDLIQEVRRVERPFSWSEDFGHFTERYSGALFGLGAGVDHPHLHDSQYDFPDELLETGMTLFSGIIDEMGLR